MADLRATFDQFDDDRDGAIAVDQLDALVRALGGEPRNVNALEAVARLESKTPGRIAFAEFRAWWEAHAASTMKTAKVRAFRDPTSDDGAADPKASGT